MRKIRFFQTDAYVSVDFFEKEAEIIRLKEIIGEADPLALTMDLGDKGQKQIYFEKPDVEPINSIKMELQEFSESILEDKNECKFYKSMAYVAKSLT